MTEQFVELAGRGVTLCADRAGSGRALLALNGTASDLRNAPNPLAWPTGDHFDTIAYDHRCLGRTEQHDPDHQPTMLDFALDAMALLDHFEIREFSMIGVSFGGMVAQEIALLAGDRLDKLVLCCTSAGGEGGSSYPHHELYERGQTMADIFGLWDIRSQYDRAIAEEMLEMFRGRRRTEGVPDGLLKQLEARRHHDMAGRLSGITADTLIAHGIYDGVAPPECSQFLADNILGAKLAPFSGGHFFLRQDDMAWRAILDFLGVPRPTAT